MPVSSSSSSTSSSLLERVKEFDPEAWDRLTRLYAPVVYTIATDALNRYRIVPGNDRRQAVCVMAGNGNMLNPLVCWARALDVRPPSRCQCATRPGCSGPRGMDTRSGTSGSKAVVLPTHSGFNSQREQARFGRGFNRDFPSRGSWREAAVSIACWQAGSRGVCVNRRGTER